MRAIPSFAGLAAVLAAGGAAEAAPAPLAKPVPSIDNVYWMVDCMASANNRDLEKSLSTVPAEGGLEKHWFKAALGDCLVAERPIPAANYFKRGAVAEKFLYRDFSSIGAAPRHRPAAVFAPVAAAYLAKAERPVLQALTMLDAASCVVRSDPARAYAFFRISRGSAEERAKVSEMAPLLAGCLPKDQPLQITPAIFRAFFAEAAYRVAAGQPEIFEGGS